MKFILFEIMKKPMERKLFIIPYAFTLANVFFGFMSIISTMHYQFASAAYFIMAAIFMDFLDGRLARILNSESSFGMQLDSLADSISFCLAPVVLLYGSFLKDSGVLGIVILTTYLCAGLLRLAKFNVLFIKNGTSSSFIGLPSPLAAFCISLIILNYKWIISSPFYFLLYSEFILVMVFSLAILMISTIKFPSFKTFNIFKVKKL